MGFWLRQHAREPATIDRVLPPRRLRKNAGKMGAGRPVEEAAGAMGQALVGQAKPSGPVVVNVPKLAWVRNQIAADRRLCGDDGSRSHNGPFHHAPPGLSQRLWLGPRVTD